jgi:hypothetical protein
MAGSFEFISRCRKRGSISSFDDRWLSMPTDDFAAAQKAFNALGCETAGMRCLTQEQATETANRMFKEPEQ